MGYYLAISYGVASFIFFSTINDIDPKTKLVYTIPYRLKLSLLAAIVWPYILYRGIVHLINK